MATPSSAGIAVLGAGPAGLTAAHLLGLRRRAGVVFEADSQVGGIAKTVEHDGFRFDLGGHRFFTKVPGSA
jgi:protoporphyrinogen oxidase